MQTIVSLQHGKTVRIWSNLNSAWSPRQSWHTELDLILKALRSDCFSILWGRFPSFKQWLVYVGVITTRLCSGINLDSCHCYVQFRLNNPNNPSSVNGIHLDVKKSCVCALICPGTAREFDTMLWCGDPNPADDARAAGPLEVLGGVEVPPIGNWNYTYSIVFYPITPGWYMMILYRFNRIPRPSHHDTWLCHVRCTFPNTLNCRMLGLSHHSSKVMRDALQIHPMWILKFCTQWFSTFFKVGRHTPRHQSRQCISHCITL